MAIDILATDDHMKLALDGEGALLLRMMALRETLWTMWRKRTGMELHVKREWCPRNRRLDVYRQIRKAKNKKHVLPPT